VTQEDLAGRPPRRMNKALVENRDVAATIYDAVGVLGRVQRRDPSLNGISLWPILTDNATTTTASGDDTKVREWLDLEHGTVYNKTIHWNALVGYLSQPDCDYWKYIFHAYNGREQLFCLDTDPYETYDRTRDRPEALRVWRQRMVQQFEE